MKCGVIMLSIFIFNQNPKNEKTYFLYFYPTFHTWGSQKIILKCFISVNENLNHKGLTYMLAELLLFFLFIEKKHHTFYKFGQYFTQIKSTILFKRKVSDRLSTFQIWITISNFKRNKLNWLWVSRNFKFIYQSNFPYLTLICLHICFPIYDWAHAW